MPQPQLSSICLFGNSTVDYRNRDRCSWSYRKKNVNDAIYGENAIEKIIYRSALKMKIANQAGVIDYVLIKAKPE
jgi:hypothetical protein